MTDYKTDYEKRIQGRSTLRYLMGLYVRWKSNLKYEKARRIARKNGAQIGEGVVMPISLARKLNHNCKIGNHVSIQTDKIDTRAPLFIGNQVIIGGYWDYNVFPQYRFSWMGAQAIWFNDRRLRLDSYQLPHTAQLPQNRLWQRGGVG